jgi:glycerol kinase
LGDQQAALFGHKCFKRGEVKNTYGTGCFLLMNTKEKIIHSNQGLLTTVAYKIGKNKANYALEGSISIAGSLVQWLRDNLNIINSSAEINKLAKSVSDNGGVYFVPAFSGLFAPYWDKTARGTIVGLTHYANKNHLARAALESVAYQTRDVFEAMKKDSNIDITSLKTDGGMTKSDILMQFQSDILGIPIIRSKLSEITALGAAYAAGLAVGFYHFESLTDMETEKFLPKMSNKEKEEKYRMWKKAVNKSKGWLDD